MQVKARISTKIKSDHTKEFRAAIERFKKSYVTVGVHEDAGTYEQVGSDEPVPVSKVAWWLENGTQNMPARPFFYPTLRHYESKIARLKAQAYASVAFAGADVEHALARIGFAVQSWVQNTIKANVPPALSASYLRRRQQRYPESGSRTLIASGLLLRSVRHKVSIDGGEPVEGPASGPEPLPLAQGKGRTHDEGLEGGEQARAMGRAMAAERKASERNQKLNAKMNPDKQLQAFNAQRRAFRSRGGRRS